MSERDPQTGGRARWTLVSVAFLVLGLVILGLSGLCTVYMGPYALGPATNGDYSGLVVMVIVTVPAMAIGALLVYAGFNARRRD